MQAVFLVHKATFTAVHWMSVLLIYTSTDEVVQAEDALDVEHSAASQTPKTGGCTTRDKHGYHGYMANISAAFRPPVCIVHCARQPHAFSTQLP